MYQNILVPLDGSSVAEQALPYALELQRLSGGLLALARVVPSAIKPPALYSMTDAETWLVRQRQMHQEAEAYLAEMTASPDMSVVDARCVVMSGDAGPSLLNLIQQEGHDVLVMAIRRRRHLARLVLGSVADYLVQHAPIPVLLVRHYEG